MIPLILCSSSAAVWDDAVAVSIVLAAIVAGAAASWWRPTRRVAIGALVLFLIGCALPGAAFLGWWPFDPRWPHDCGATPDPNVAVAAAALAFPFILAASFALVRMLRRGRAG